MSLLTVRNLNITAGRATLVRNVSFTVNKGEILALVGESGSGKSLTALSLLRLLPEALTQSGEVRFEGRGARGEVKNLDPRFSTLDPIRGLDAGMIFQEPMTSLNPLHTISRQIAEAIRIHQRALSERKVQERVLELLEKVGLAHFKDRLGAYPHQLSGGERQRVMIAMAIANDPALLIADEPTTALDVTVQAKILDLITDLRTRLGMAVLLITHDLPLVGRIADRVAIMSQGEVVDVGRTAEIFANPKHPYKKQLLASEPGGAPEEVSQERPVLLQWRDGAVSYETASGPLGWKKTRHSILSGVNLRVKEGTTLGVVGESGSGKTTLALALLRLIASEGEITLGGVRIDALSGKALRDRRRDMQIVFQDPYSSLNPRMTVDTIISEGLGIHAPQMTKAQKEDALAAILQEVGLPPEAQFRYPHEFSGGQRQRISIARALILRPRLLILDEPTSALDRSVQAQILELLKNLQEKHGLTYIFISHDLRVIRAMSHYIMVLKSGRVVEEGSARRVFEAPKEEYTQALLKAAML